MLLCLFESPSCYPEDEVFGSKDRVERFAKQLKRQSCLATQIIMVIFYVTLQHVKFNLSLGKHATMNIFFVITRRCLVL